MRLKMPLRGLVALLLAALVTGIGVAHSAGATPEGRVIVQLRTDAPTAAPQVQHPERARALGARVGLPLRTTPGPAADMIVLSADGIDSEELAARLAAEPDVEFAVPDRRRRIRAVPNDPLYGEQWLLHAVQPAAINAQGAWDVTTGSPGIVVAVLDTGVRFEHEDLAERLLPGYDFILDAKTAGHGKGRNPDASDPGDFLTAQDLLDPFFAGCGDGPDGTLPTVSSWHGTRVSGTVAATGNNSRGVAGVSWSSRILPVRVLGKCGGFDSDIIAAMRWAAGLNVPGVPTNPQPAHVVNLSLGAPGQCTAAYEQVLRELIDARVLVVAAAGNNSMFVEAPGNCPGVLTVGALRHVGTKVGFSSHGPEVDIGAPGGNCVNGGFGEPCLFQIPTTTNLGTTLPAANGYSDGFNATVGTSFAAPLAAGTAALMMSVHPGLAPDAIRSRMAASARPHAAEEGLPLCPGFDLNSGQCNCTKLTCGAGVLDAHGAVLEAMRPQALAAVSSTQTGVTLDASGSTAMPGQHIVSWRWQQLDGPTQGGFTQPQAASTMFIAALPSDYRVSLTVTDSAGRSDTTVVPVSVGDGAVGEPPPPPAPELEPEPEPDDERRKPRKGGGGAADAWAVLGVLMLAALALASSMGVSRRRRVVEAAGRPASVALHS